jgi:hypothetical protein
LGHRSIPGFCERCGQRFELTPPAPGERDLGLDRIQASFRYCAGCKLYVGRTCCWNPDAVACIVDAPPFALVTSPQSGGQLEGSQNEFIARRALAELTASLVAIEHVDDRVAYAPQTEEDRENGGRAWEDAWWGLGWLIARVETSRDAAAKALRRVAGQADESTTEGLTGQLTSLVDRYVRARAMIEARLVAAGRSLARRNRRWPLVVLNRRVEPAMIGVGSLAVVGVLAFGSAALLQLGYLDPFAVNADAVASQPDEAVLGGAGGPRQSSSATSTAGPREPEAVIAQLDFDELRIGELAGASEEITEVVGGPQVVAFPSPFDRSIRVVGDGSHRFCMPVSDLVDGRVSFQVALYAENSTDSGQLSLSAAPSGSGSTAASVPLRLLDGLTLRAWHRLRAVWTPRQPITVAIGDAPLGSVQTVNLPPAQDAHAIAGAVCIAVSGMAPNAVLLLDNLRVEQ